MSVFSILFISSDADVQLQMNQFAQYARERVQTHMPSLSKAIYRIPDAPPPDSDLPPIALQLDDELMQVNKRLNT